MNLRGSPAAAVLATSWLLSGAAPGAEVDPGASVETLGDRAARILAQAIRLESVNPPGDERPVAEYFVRLLREAGLEAALVETPPGDSQVGRAAAWGRLPGTGERRPLVLLSHLDVVPADPDAWQMDPFAGIRRGDLVIGRGALDAKGIAVVHLLAVSQLARRGTTLKRDVLFLSTPDEETGGMNGAGYLVRERSDLLLDAEYVLTEGGGVRTGAQGGPPVWGIAIIEKSPCWMRIVAHGTPGHSSAPPRDAAVPRLVAALERVRRLDHPIRVVPEVQRMFAALAPIALPEDAHGYTDLATSLVADPAFRSRFMAERANAALVRNSLSITVLQGAAVTNVLPREASAHLDGRLLPFERCDAFVDRVRQSAADSRITVETLLSFRSRSSRIDTPLYRAIRNIAGVTDPGAIVVPRMLAGFTDAHFFRDLGITAYGFVPRWHRGGEVRGIHAPGEHISLENLERGVNTLIAILEELDRID